MNKRHSNFIGKLLLCVVLALAATPLLVSAAIAAGIHQGKLSAARLVVAMIVFAGGLGIRFVRKEEPLDQTDYESQVSEAPQPEVASEPAPQASEWPPVQVELAPGQAALEVVSGVPAREMILLLVERTVIGRLPTCNIMLARPTVARNHAQILKCHDGYSIEDMRSPGGTLVNGTRITGPTQLKDGDQIRIAIVIMHFHKRDA